MKFIPFYQFKLKLPYNKDEALSRLYDNTKPSSFGDTHSRTKIFYGTLTDSSFKISKILKWYYENSFNPLAIGKLTDDGYYCHVNVVVRPTLSTLIFMFIWIGFFLKGLVVGLIVSNTIIWFNLGFVAFGYILLSIGFWIEVPKLEIAMRKLLEDSD